MKKQYLFAILLAFSTLTAFAQIPQAINFEAIARDAQGRPLSSGNVIIQFSIFNNTTLIYEEIHVNIPVNYKGLFNAPIGKGTATTGVFSQIDWAASGVKAIDVKINNVLESRSELLSVPFALYAKNAAVADRLNITYGDGLSYNAATNTLSNTRPAQNLTYSNSVLSISGGNSVVIPSPNLTYSNGVLSVAGGNSVLIPTAINYTAGQGISIANGIITNTKPSKWENGLVANSINYQLGNVGIGREASNFYKLAMNGTMLVQNPTYPKDYVEHGDYYTTIYSDDTLRYQAAGYNGGLGVVGTYGKGGAYCRFSRLAGFLDNPYIALTTGTPTVDNVPKVGILIDGNGHGRMQVNENGFMQAGFYYDTNLFRWTATANIKSFHEPHPTKPDKEIWYACIEGREAAMYVRGTARLENGKATITFPEDFSLMAVGEGMTASLTPGDALSKGLAVVRKTTLGIEVQELSGGNGNYTFDWEVKAVRKGYERFQVVRDRMKGDAIDDPKNQKNALENR